MLVTDPRYSGARILEVVRAVASASMTAGALLAVQLRDRTARADAELLPLATELRAITKGSGALLVVNRRYALARRVGADGVHGPAGELPRDFAWRSAPAHTDDELQTARSAGATAALVSPIFASPDKGSPRGTAALAAARRVAPEMTLVALGGISAENARECLDAGADAVAVIRALLDAEDPARVMKCLGHRAP